MQGAAISALADSAMSDSYAACSAYNWPEGGDAIGRQLAVRQLHCGRCPFHY